MPCPLVSGAQSETEFLHIKLQGTTGLLDSPAHLKRGVRDVVSVSDWNCNPIPVKSITPTPLNRTEEVCNNNTSQDYIVHNQ